MAREKRNWHPEFIKYCEKLVDHLNFSDFPYTRNSHGTIRWVQSKKSLAGLERTAWWRKKAVELGMPTEGKWIAAVAKANHPWRKRPCQICGEIRHIDYVYPNKGTARQLANAFPDIGVGYDKCMHIKDIANLVFEAEGESGLSKLTRILNMRWGVGTGFDAFVEELDEEVIGGESRKLSPGAMSNAPDRLDGFHTYMICCRKKQDTGRHDSNMSTYGQDRRAYENWSDGHLKAASKMMKQGAGDYNCAMCNRWLRMTADHIGPVSLCFAHRYDGFQPLCSGCQSGKRDRLFPHDIQLLLQHEQDGSTVISWHAKGLWDRFKNEIDTDEDGERLASLLKRNQRAFIEVMHVLYERGYGVHLLNFLDADQFLGDVEFVGIRKGQYTCDKMIFKLGSKDQYRNNAGRYLRVAFDSLQEYVDKENRRIRRVGNPLLNRMKQQLLDLCEADDSHPQELIDAFEQARSEPDKNVRSQKFYKVWQEWRSTAQGSSSKRMFYTPSSVAEPPTRLLRPANDSQDVVLDSFAGSGSSDMVIGNPPYTSNIPLQESGTKPSTVKEALENYMRGVWTVLEKEW